MLAAGAARVRVCVIFFNHFVDDFLYRGCDEEASVNQVKRQPGGMISCGQSCGGSLRLEDNWDVDASWGAKNVRESKSVFLWSRTGSLLVHDGTIKGDREEGKKE